MEHESRDSDPHRASSAIFVQSPPATHTEAGLCLSSPNFLTSCKDYLGEGKVKLFYVVLAAIETTSSVTTCPAMEAQLVAAPDQLML